MLTISEFIFDRLLFPKECLGCGKIGQYFCQQCILKIYQKELVCPECERLSIGGKTHPLCQKKYGVDGLWSLGMYQDPLKKAVQKLKYRFVRELAEELIDITIKYWAQFQPQILDEIKKDRGEGWAIVPVPLHKSRENWRGFNQSALIGKLLAKKLGLKYEELLIRTKNTPTQTSLSSYFRKKNVKGAFQISKLYYLSSNILLIDDVWTTGSTLKECAYVLKRNGAQKVWALTIAR